MRALKKFLSKIDKLNAKLNAIIQDVGGDPYFDEIIDMSALNINNVIDINSLKIESKYGYNGICGSSNSKFNIKFKDFNPTIIDEEYIINRLEDTSIYDALEKLYYKSYIDSDNKNDNVKLLIINKCKKIIEDISDIENRPYYMEYCFGEQYELKTLQELTKNTSLIIHNVKFVCSFVEYLEKYPKTQPLKEVLELGYFESKLLKNIEQTKLLYYSKTSKLSDKVYKSLILE